MKKFSFLFILIGFLFASEYGVRYQNHYVCGIFPTPLNSYKKIIITGNNAKVCNSSKIAYPENNLTGSIKCSINDCNGEAICERIDPPANTYNYDFPVNSKAGAPNGDNPTTLIDLKYGDLTYNNKTVTFNPQNTYIDNNETKVMLLGNVNVSKSTLNFEPGDYFFESLTIDNNNNNIVLPHGGPVRIFIKKDFNVSLNNFHLNKNGNAGDLFIYVGGNFNSIGNGGGTTQLKGFIYVKGTTTLNNNSNNWKIYGAITSEGDLYINGNNPDFIGGSSADNLGYGKCDMCYEQPKNGSGISFNFGNCPGISIGMNKSIYVPIKTDDTLNNVSIDELHKKSLFNFSYFNKNEVVDQDGNKVRDANQHDDGLFNAGFLGIEASLFDKKIVTYPLGDDNYTYGPTDNDNYQQLYTYTLFGFDFCKWYESLVYVGHYDKDGKHYDVIVSPCETNNNNSVYTTGPFDAWDTFRNINDRHISTKVVNKEFNLTIASINADNNATEIKFGIDAQYRLYDMEHNQSITPWYDYNASLLPVKNVQLPPVEKAYKDVRVNFKFCQTKTSNGIEIVPLKMCENGGNNGKYEYNTSTMSSDNFAIRPYAFMVFGNNQYKRAGEDFNITIKAVDEANYSLTQNSGITVDNVKGINGYNEFLDNLNINSKFYVPTDEETRQMNYDIYEINDTNRSRVAYCPDAGTFSVIGNPKFNNGEVNATLQFSETGILEINVSEKNGSEFAKVDEDDTPDSQRFIKPANIILDKDDINKTDLLMFIPYKFETDGDVNTIPESPNNWIYMSNDVNKSNETNETPKMAGFITYDIKAYSKDGNQLKNYTKTCFPDTEDSAPKKNGLKLNTTFDLFLDTDLNITKNATASFYTTDNNDTPIWTMNKEVNLTEGNNSLREWIGATNFENGEGKAKVYFNINKNYKIPSEEINITINDINTSTSWMNNPGATNKFIGKNINKTIEFRYGRIHVKEATGIGNEVNTTFKYEYWDKNKGWVINKEHSKDFGEVNLSKSYVDATRFDNSPMKNSRAYDVENGLQNVKFTTTHSLPYSAKVHLSIPNWLWYNPLAKDYKDPSSSNHDCRTHPCMKVTFYPNSSGWAGISGGSKKLQKEFNESKRTVEVNTSKEVNISKKEVKKINW